MNTDAGTERAEGCGVFSLCGYRRASGEQVFFEALGESVSIGGSTDWFSVQ
jgi:hypothetical protein